jgi:DNA-binding beta-propeller fold protein YncE
VPSRLRGICFAALFLSLPLFAQAPSKEELDARAEKLRALLRGSPSLPLKMGELPVQAPRPDWSLEMVSSVAVDRKGMIYLLQRGAKADPVIAVDRDGRILRSWGKGLYKIPHSIRIDPSGNVWTADAASSMVYKFSPEGKLLLEINVGGLPANPRSEFCGTTDIAFAPDERVFISDGYANARILEYRANGKRIREWGSPGTGPGEFRLPHGLTIDREGIIYVADRENGRIQRFNLEGRYLGEWNDLGKTFSITVTPAGDLWIGTQPHNVANGVEPWLVKVDRKTGKIIGCVESKGHHSVDVNSDGEPLTGARPDKVLWFRSSR